MTLVSILNKILILQTNSDFGFGPYNFIFFRSNYYTSTKLVFGPTNQVSILIFFLLFLGFSPYNCCSLIVFSPAFFVLV